MSKRIQKYKKRSLIISLVLLGITIFAWSNTLYIYTKAELAQYLIKDAWQQTLKDGYRHRPWSWADTWPVAQLKSSKMKGELFVLAGASGTSLAFGPGHLDGSSLPSEMGTIVIGGHRDTHFKFMQKLQYGDVLELQDKRGKWTKYQVHALEIHNTETDQLHSDLLDHELVLITCYPFDALISGGPLRFVVKAKPLANEKKANATNPPDESDAHNLLTQLVF